jgi:serine/threonine protein kinase
MIGEFALDTGEPLGEGPGWQDFLVTHPRAHTKHRVRLFPYPKGAGRDARSAVDLRAEREYRLTFGIRHHGIIGPTQFPVTEEGPALVFDYDPEEVSLGVYLDPHASDLSFDARERLVQDLVELVRFAHGQRLTHRALSPLSVRVKVGADGSTVLRIRDWDLARRPDTGTSTATVVSRGLTDIVGAVESDALLYLAPETLRGQSPASAQTLDVYGVGALAFLILTGKPPAVNSPALEALITSDAEGLDPRAVMPELSDEYASVILRATSFDEGHRTLDISIFEADFEQARRNARGPEPAPTQGDPLDAAVGDIVGDRFEIVRRRGSGSTGVALEVNDYELEAEHVILKLAKDDAAAARLGTEAGVLAQLDHPRIVKLLAEPLRVGTRQALLMSDAGAETLADRIRLEGRGTIEQLERYAADLFDAAAHLESRGVFHRDIKPTNVAIRPDPSTRKPRLTLFDFSLSSEPLTNIRSGSRPYVDPYLGSGGRSQYDSAAERFALAATLFELATSDPIWWEQGDAPSSATDAPIVQASMFDPAVAEGLIGFFRSALAPQAADRHPTLEAMRAAWVTALEGAAVDEVAAEANDAKAVTATLTTQLTDSGLSARALSALARLQVSTVGELLGVPPMVINQIRGLGEQVRREISSRVREWRYRLTTTTTVVEPSASAGRRSLESLVASADQKPDESSEDRYKRLRKYATLKGATEDAARWIHDLGDVATLDEVAAKLLREYGSTLTEDMRMPAAIALVRAILELDARSREPRFLFHSLRDRSRTAIAYTPEDCTGLSFEDAEFHLETLLRFGGVVDELLTEGDVVPAPRLRENLLAAAPPLRVPDGRLTQLAIGLSTKGRMSSMGEAYRADLEPSRAVELALRGAATRELAVVTIEQRVHARFPDVPAIPSRPALDAHVRLAMPYLEWQEGLGKYAMRAVDISSMTYSGTSTTWGRSSSDPAVAARLAGSIRDRGALVLAVSRRSGLAGAAGRLGRDHGLKVVDLAEVALDALRRTATEKRIDWKVVLRADGAPTQSQDRRNLLQLARLAVKPVWLELLASPEPMIFINAGLLARLGLVDLIAAVTDLGTPRTAARWFLLPRPLSGGTPDLDGTPMPFGADGWIDLSLDPLLTPGPADVPALKGTTP